MNSDQRRYQVFVSSTFLDLKEHRQAVIAALLECDAFPSGMELFPAADDDAWTLIKKVIDECDYYLLVIGGKYGSIDPENSISYTEMEFDYAVSQKKPVMAFLHGDPESMPVGLSEVTDEKREKLESFRTRVQRTKHVKYWTSTDQLAGQVALTFNRFTRLYEATGWMRANRATSRENLEALAEAKYEIERLQQELDHSQTTSAPPGTEQLSQGDDSFELPTLASGYIYKESGARPKVSAWVQVETNWNDILGAIGPRLFDECEQEQIRQAVQEWLDVYHREDLSGGIEAALKKRGDEWDEKRGVSQVSGEIDDEDLGTLLVQLKALGLITNSSRKRSVSDTGTYWTLTPYGETETIKIRALKKPADSSAVTLAGPNVTRETV